MLDDKYKEKEPLLYKEIEAMVKKNKFSHAYLIEANSFSYGKSVAFAMAKVFLCQEHYEDLSFIEKTSQEIDSNHCVDFMVIEPCDQWIKKEQLIELQIEFNMKSLTRKNRVYVILGAEKLNRYAANSLLKFLEEPEEGIIAILVTMNHYQVLPTIVSRCQFYHLKNDQVHEYLQDDVQPFLNNIELIEKYGIKSLAYATKYTVDMDKKSMGNFMTFCQYIYGQALYKMLGYEIQVQEFCQYIVDIIVKNNKIDDIIKKLNSLVHQEEALTYNVNLKLWFDKLIIMMG